MKRKVEVTNDGNGKMAKGSYNLVDFYPPLEMVKDFQQIERRGIVLANANEEDTARTYSLKSFYNPTGYNVIRCVCSIVPNEDGDSEEMSRIVKHAQGSVTQKRFIRQSLVEAQILLSAVSPNIVKCFAASVSFDFNSVTVHTVMERGELCLADIGQSFIHVTPHFVSNFLYQALMGLNYLNEQLLIIHGDFKLDNVLLSGDRIMLCDFNLALPLYSTMGNNGLYYNGTYGLIPPEILLHRLNGGNPTMSVKSNLDVWPLAVCLQELILGSNLFNHEDTEDPEIVKRYLEEINDFVHGEELLNNILSEAYTPFYPIVYDMLQKEDFRPSPQTLLSRLSLECQERVSDATTDYQPLRISYELEDQSFSPELCFHATSSTPVPPPIFDTADLVVESIHDYIPESIYCEEKGHYVYDQWPIFAHNSVNVTDNCWCARAKIKKGLNYHSLLREKSHVGNDKEVVKPTFIYVTSDSHKNTWIYALFPGRFEGTVTRKEQQLGLKKARQLFGSSVLNSSSSVVKISSYPRMVPFLSLMAKLAGIDIWLDRVLPLRKDKEEEVTKITIAERLINLIPTRIVIGNNEWHNNSMYVFSS